MWHYCFNKNSNGRGCRNSTEARQPKTTTFISIVKIFFFIHRPFAKCYYYYYTYGTGIVCMRWIWSGIYCVISEKGWHKICSNKIESQNELVSQCDQLAESFMVFGTLLLILFLYHTLYSPLALSLSLYLYSTSHIFYARLDFHSAFYCITRTCSTHTQTKPSQMLPIFMTFSWFFSHWNNSLDRRCCRDVNTIPFGWLQSIKKLFFLYIYSNRSVGFCLFYAVNFITWLTITWHFQLAFHFIGSLQKLTVFCTTHTHTQLFSRMASVEMFNQV